MGKKETADDVLTVVNCYIAELWNFSAAGKLSLAIGAALTSVLLSLGTSARFSQWLLKTHSVVRTSKFYH